MDIHIILNPGAVGTPSNAQSKKKTPRRRSRTPTSAQSSSGSAIHRRSSLRAKSSSTVGSRSAQKSYATPAPIHLIRRHPSSVRQPPSSPLLRQSRTRKRALELELGFEGEDRDAPIPPKRGRSSTSTHSSRSSAGSSAMFESATIASGGAPSRASLLLSRAKQHVALEAVALGRRSRSMMDVVMDLKGPVGESEYQEDGNVLMFIEDRSRHDASYLGHDYLLTDDASYLRRDNNSYVLTDDEGLAAYWADQAAIWMHTDVGAASGFHWNSNLHSISNSDSGSDWAEVALTRFPMSMERSTAAWECP